MRNRRPGPDMMETFVPQDGAFVVMVTQMDFQKMEGRFKVFPNIAEADKDYHDFSLSQAPNARWHREFCPVCKAKPPEDQL